MFGLGNKKKKLLCTLNYLKQVAQWATIAHLRASIMYGDYIIYDAQRHELETVIRNKFKKKQRKPGETIFL